MLEICLFLALACSYCAASGSDRTIAQFAHTAWGPKDGAPSSVTSLSQTSDGYLWLGDIVFEHYQPQSGGPFPVGSVSQLGPSQWRPFGSVMGIEETPDGGLWLAESRGVVHIPASEAQHALDNPSYRVKYRLFDSFDGLSGTFAATGAF